MGTKIAAKEHAEFINLMEFIDCMAPGLYEIVITEKTEGDAGADLVVGGYNVRIEARGIEDILALGGNSLEDEREFATVARMAAINESLYRTFLQPWVRATATPQTARWLQELNPLRLWYTMFSDKNPLMGGVETLAEQALAERKVPSADNPFLVMQEQILQLHDPGPEDVRRPPRPDAGADVSRDLRLAAGADPVRDFGQRWSTAAAAGILPWAQKALEAEVVRLKERLTEGGPLEAAARALTHISPRARIGWMARSFEVLQRLLAAHPDITLAHFKGVAREQWAMLAIDERAAVAALPQLAPQTDAERRALVDMIKEIVAAVGAPSDDVKSRMAGNRTAAGLRAGQTQSQAQESRGATEIMFGPGGIMTPMLQRWG